MFAIRKHWGPHKYCSFKQPFRGNLFWVTQLRMTYIFSCPVILDVYRIYYMQLQINAKKKVPGLSGFRVMNNIKSIKHVWPFQPTCTRCGHQSSSMSIRAVFSKSKKVPDYYSGMCRLGKGLYNSNRFIIIRFIG